MNEMSHVQERRSALQKRGRFASWTGISQASKKFSRGLGLFGLSFCAFVLVPTLITFLYTLTLASEQFVSEARFAVRSPDVKPSPASDALSMLSSFTGVRSTTQDAFIVADYIRSRTIIEDLGGKSVAAEIYSRRSIDWLSRLKTDASLEDTLFYWRRKVLVAIDTQSNIVTLRVIAFSRQEAKTLADRIIERSEALVNEISLRSRRDAYARAETEVQLAMQRLGTLRAALLSFRNKANVIDPLAGAASIGETLTLLTREKITLESNRSSLRKSIDENSPTIRFLSTQIDSIDKQIALLQSRLTGHVKGLETAASQLADYEDLKLQSQFAEKLLEISQGSLERARREHQQQQLYLVAVVQPTTPEEATYPRPAIDPAIAFSICLVIWSMVTLVMGSIRDHMG